MELSVIVPCFDEEANVAELVRRVAGVLDDAHIAGRGGGELILVDDGSGDGTWALIQEQARGVSRVRAFRHEVNQGIVAAWRTGCARARGRLVCLLDADLQYQPEEILALLRAWEESGADIAQGARRWADGERGSRYWISRGFNLLVNGVFGMRSSDNKSGFLLCDRRVLEDLLQHGAGYRYWQLFVMVAAERKGYSCRSVETPFVPRRRGRSFLPDLPLRVMALALVDLGRALAEYGARSRAS